MKINFREERFTQLLDEAKTLGLSIPRLIDNILEEHYTHRRSHTGVSNIEREIKTGVPDYTRRCINTDKN